MKLLTSSFSHGWVEAFLMWGGWVGMNVGMKTYITSLRLGGHKLPTYELMLRLLGVATMGGWVDWVQKR